MNTMLGPDAGNSQHNVCILFSLHDGRGNFKGIHECVHILNIPRAMCEINSRQHNLENNHESVWYCTRVTKTKH